VGFVADKVVLGECFLRERPFSTVRVIPPVVREHLCVYNQHYIILTFDCVAKKKPSIPIQFLLEKGVILGVQNVVVRVTTDVSRDDKLVGVSTVIFI